MKILSPQQVNEKLNVRESAARNTYADISKKTQDAMKKLNLVEGEIKRQSLVSKLVIEEREQTVALLNVEVSILEEKKKSAMEPVEELRKKAQERLKEIEAKERSIEVKETDLESREAQMLDRLEAIEEQEYKINNKKEELGRRENGVEAQEEEVLIMTKNLQKSLTKHHEEIALFNKDVESTAHRHSQIEHALKVRSQSLDTREKKLREKERALNDRQQTLERTITRYKKGKL